MSWIAIRLRTVWREVRIRILVVQWLLHYRLTGTKNVGLAYGVWV